MGSLLYTSCYRKVHHHEKGLAISCTVKDPFYDTRRYQTLAPVWSTMVEPYRLKQITFDEYTDRYLDLIENVRRLKAADVVEDLPNGTILLCYEPTPVFCHRGIVARWIKENTGVIVTEWSPKREKERHDLHQHHEQLEGLVNFG